MANKKACGKTKRPLKSNDFLSKGIHSLSPKHTKP
jgi:hypothetical protein